MNVYNFIWCFARFDLIVSKAQEHSLDALYWNSTLRIDQSELTRRREANGSSNSSLNGSGVLQAGAEIGGGMGGGVDEIDEVYRRGGLVALSLCGNNFMGKGIYTLTRVLRDNFWMLGEA